jgi:hypothetical protein
MKFQEIATKITGDILTNLKPGSVIKILSKKIISLIMKVFAK